VSNFAIGAIPSQVEKGYLKPVAFYSRKMDKAEINYEIYDKEILAIISAFKEWRRYLQGTSFKITIYSDHQNLEYFATTKALKCSQARWSQELVAYDFKMVYPPGSKNERPDMLSRGPEYRSKWGSILDEDEKQPIATVLKPEHFGYLEPELDSPLTISSVKLQKILEVRFHDTFPEKVAIAGESDHDWIKEYKCGMSGNQSLGISYLHRSLYYERRLWIPYEESLQKKILE
jgi:hypothetical protein